MEHSPIIQINPTEEFHGKVALPFNKDQFQSFITGLLGKPQVINKRFNGSFEIDIQFIGNLVEIIEQRMHQQNDSALLQLRSTISYNDGSSVSLSGYEHLINFNEPLPLICQGLHLTFQYLIKFKDKETAEKQEITVSFLATGSSFYEESHEYSYHPSNINFRIAHTARTFGADIEALLTKHLKPLVTQDKKLKWIHNLDDMSVQNSIKFLLISLTAYCSYKWIDYQKTYILIYLFALTYAFTNLVDLLIAYVTPSSKPSFILITPESKKQKVKDLKNYKQEWLKFIFATIGSLILGVIGNYLYAYFTK